MSIDFKGFTVFKNDMLPPNTLMVSPDVYEKLTETPEQRAAREAEVQAQFDKISSLMAAYGLATHGKELHRQANMSGNLPKGPKP